MKCKLAGLYAITPDEPRTDILVDKVSQALRGGASSVQYRNKTAGPELRLEQGRALAALCRAAGAAFIVNDDVALALELGADGAHLGADDGDLAEARRRLGLDKLLGASCYNRIELAEAAAQAGVNYLAFGSVFSSSTKPGAVRAPLSLFAEARRSFALPLVAIGGITLQNASQVFAAGADVVAVISAVFDAADVAERAAGFTRLYQQQRMQQ
ncbi:MAG: thiamine-phosphate diphosphorylase [Betaproteobacteria bacterium RIFCSPLOWO2_12_FULL_62_13b]|nr:MAG: thiamine-phosphate diphosphorylase [Betaproteobacteria bacterium RIFCSPLOWO2_12_FULL_62_13b]